MRPLLPLFLLLASTAAFAQPTQPPAASPREGHWGSGARGPRGSVFLSPMGEPFRSDDPAADNVGTWFTQADTDHDGALTVAEMQADAARFFAMLDTNHDGEIDPAELTRYESEIAPEVQVGAQMGERSSFGREGGGRRSPNGGFDEGLEGAGRYSFINIPEPVISADADLNRGVSKAEFLAAAARRFLMLDINNDGRLTRAELPPLPVRGAGKPKKRKGGPVRAEGEPLPL
jgi:hypothetical protein